MLEGCLCYLPSACLNTVCELLVDILAGWDGCAARSTRDCKHHIEYMLPVKEVHLLLHTQRTKVVDTSTKHCFLFLCRNKIQLVPAGQPSPISTVHPTISTLASH